MKRNGRREPLAVFAKIKSLVEIGIQQMRDER